MPSFEFEQSRKARYSITEITILFLMGRIDAVVPEHGGPIIKIHCSADIRRLRKQCTYFAYQEGCPVEGKVPSMDEVRAGFNNEVHTIASRAKSKIMYEIQMEKEFYTDTVLANARRSRFSSSGQLPATPKFNLLKRIYRGSEEMLYDRLVLETRAYLLRWYASGTKSKPFIDDMVEAIIKSVI